MFKYPQRSIRPVAQQTELLDDAAILNEKLVSLPRIKLLQILDVFDPDGIAFRELQAHLDMTDGKLLSNLYALRDMAVIEEHKARIENKTLTTYRLTDIGRDQWHQARAWLRQWLETP